MPLPWHVQLYLYIVHVCAYYIVRGTSATAVLYEPRGITWHTTGAARDPGAGVLVAACSQLRQLPLGVLL